jgi:ABC-type sugar transport system permease subunit
MIAKTFKTKPKFFRTLEPYLYLAPATIILILVFVYPIIQVVRLSFLQPLVGGNTAVSLFNYQMVFEDPVFWLGVRNNGELLLTVPLMTVLGLLLAILLYEQVIGWKIYRTLIYMPSILAVPTVGLAFVYLLGLNGIINTMLRHIGLGFITQEWIGSAKWVVPAIGVVIIYREVGFGVILFLARLMSLDAEILEAAEIDGANWWQKHAYVTIPQLGVVIEFFVIVEFITMLSSVFGYVYTMTAGGPSFASTVMEFYIWKHAFAFRTPGMASAVAVFLLIVTSVLIILQLRLRHQSLD